jgi:hypothetical protein
MRKVDLEEPYTVAGAERRMRLDTVLSWVVIVGISIGFSVLSRLRFSTESEMAWPTVACGIGMFACAGGAIAGFRGIIMDQAHRMEAMHGTAEALNVRSELFYLFKPTLEQVDRQLGILALRFDLACKRQAEFYQENRTYLGDRATGSRAVIQGDLVNQEEALKSSIRITKANFWELYDALRDQGYHPMRDGWIPYLTHSGVGPDDPELQEDMEGRNEPPGQ